MSEDFLAAHWKADDLDIPPWSPIRGDSAGFSLTSFKPALKVGLKARPLEVTASGARYTGLVYTLPAERQAKLGAGLDPPKGVGHAARLAQERQQLSAPDSAQGLVEIV